MPSHNSLKTNGDNNLSIQGIKQSTININTGTSAETKLPKELTLTIPKTHLDDIIGREDDLEELHTLLNTQKKVVVVNGLGGIGKTTLAQAYLSKYYDDYHHIAWITQSSDNLASEFLNTAGLLENFGIDTAQAEPEKILAEIIRKMKGVPDKPNLLAIDNAETSVKKYRDMLPGQPQWHLLLTSREELPGFYHKRLDFLTQEQAVALFRKHYTRPQLNEQDIKDLIVAVDYHTLTIELLAKTAQVQRYDAATLRGAIESDLRANVEISHQSATVEKVGTYLRTVFTMSWLSETEIWLLKQFACLPADFHSYDLLKGLLINEQSPYADVFAETLAELTRKGWLLQQTDTDSYKMHPIISEVVRKKHPINPADVNNLLYAITQTLSIDQTKDNPVDKFVWIPFGKALLAAINDDSATQLLTLQNNLALRLQDLSDYAGARTLLEKALRSAEQNFGPDHPTTATRYSNLATVLQDLGDYEGARTLLEKALRSAEQNFGPDHPTTATRYSNLALVLKALGDYEGARTLLEKALRSAEQNFGPDHPNTARSYSNLALVLQALGDYEGARTLLEKALRSDEQNFGPDHPTTAVSYSNLATVQKDLGEYPKALELSGQALAIFKNVLPAGHPNIQIVSDIYESIQTAIAQADKLIG